MPWFSSISTNVLEISGSATATLFRRMLFYCCVYEVIVWHCVQETFEGDERFWFETMMVVIESTLSTESKKHRDRYTKVLTTFDSRQSNLWQR